MRRDPVDMQLKKRRLLVFIGIVMCVFVIIGWKKICFPDCVRVCVNVCSFESFTNLVLLFMCGILG